MHTFAQMAAEGYRFGAPSQEAEDIDAQVAEHMNCGKCGSSMRYEGYYKLHEYIALAVCNRCGHQVEF
jgi:transcription elongation factor Elf1